MTYLVIDTDGVLHERDEHPTAAVVEREVGPEGWDTVPLRQHPNLYGWVNDCGHLSPQRYPRNVVGSCVLACFGGSQQPYAGPVVVTGWDPQSAGPEIRPLAPDLARAVRNVHRDVSAALAGQDPAHLPPGWAETVRRFAEHVRTAPAPTITVLSHDETLAYLRGERRG